MIYASGHKHGSVAFRFDSLDPFAVVVHEITAGIVVMLRKVDSQSGFVQSVAVPWDITARGPILIDCFCFVIT